MANFNEKINWGTGHVLRDQECNYFIERIGSMGRLKLEFDYISHFLESNYRLIIQYKDTYRVQKMAGRCFMWSCTSNGRGGGCVRNLCLDRDGNEDLDNFGNPKFDYIAGAVFITDKYVLTYGDTWFEAVEISVEHVVCKAYVCGRFVSEFRIPAEVFDRLFGLKENFPEQCAKPVQEKALQSEKIYDAYEMACLMDSNRLCSDLLSSLLRLNSVINSHKDVYDKSQSARKAVEDLAIELGISIRNIEDGLK